MLVYGATIANEMEEKGYYLLQKVPGYESIARNNLVVATQPDYSVGSRLGDCQYSGDFAKWGDLRLDLISAYDSSENYKVLQDSAIYRSRSHQGNLKSFLQSLVKVNKWGKIFDDIAFVLYFLYGSTVRTINDVQCKPTKVILLDIPKVRDMVENKWREMVGRRGLRFNSKKGTGDDFGSAFLAIKPSQLYGCSLDITTLMNEV